MGKLGISTTVCWVITLLAFIAANLMGLRGWDANIGGGFALLLGTFFGFVAQLLTMAAVLVWVIRRVKGQWTGTSSALRNLLWGGTAVLVLNAAMSLGTGFHLSSPLIIYLLSSAVVLGLLAASISVDDWQRARRSVAN